MHLSVRTSLVGVTLVAVFGWATAVRATEGQQKPAPAAEQHDHDAADHEHPATADQHAHAEGEEHAAGAHTHAAAAAVKNPVAADEKSVAAGKALYTTNCTACHGVAGLGDGKMGATMKVQPANLADAEWKHGPSDGEIYKAIKTGIKAAGMRAFSPKLTDHQIWDVVNYVRSIGPAKSH